MIFYIIGTVLVTLFGGLGLFFAKSPKARRWLKTKVKNRWKAQGAEVNKSRTARGLTPRGKRRAQRKTQPLGLLVRKRAPDDPRTVRKAVDRVNLARANRKATHVDKPKAQPVTQRILEAVNPTPQDIPNRRTAEQVESTMTTCQAFTAEGDGTCHRPAKHDAQGNTLFHCGIPSHARQFAAKARHQRKTAG